MVLEIYRYVWLNDDMREVENVIFKCLEYRFFGQVSVGFDEWVQGVVQGVLSFFRVMLVSVWRDLVESVYSFIWIDYIQFIRFYGFGKMWIKKGFQELVGRFDGERVEGYEGVGDIFLQSCWILNWGCGLV